MTKEVSRRKNGRDSRSQSEASITFEARDGGGPTQAGSSETVRKSQSSGRRVLEPTRLPDGSEMGGDICTETKDAS